MKGKRVVKGRGSRYTADLRYEENISPDPTPRRPLFVFTALTFDNS